MSEPAETDEKPKRMTVEEYLAFEAQGEAEGRLEKHEFHDGELIAMAGAAENHVLIDGNLIRTLGNALKTGPCRVYGPDMKVQVDPGGRFVYPDLTVACEPRFRDDEKKRLTLVNPKVIFEILSDSTERRDAKVKVPSYTEVPSVEAIFLVDQDTAHVQGFIRRPDDRTWQWTYATGRDATVRVDCLGLDLPLAELYRNVTLDDDPAGP